MIYIGNILLDVYGNFDLKCSTYVNSLSMEICAQAEEKERNQEQHTLAIPQS
uniref:Uncharacterized protein n=1 Tax=Romanomermis culicivorax TaxID=13658 RepID=A0A915JMB8_ROMCU